MEPQDMEMNPDTIKALLDAFERSDWQEMTITVGADQLHVSRDGTTTSAPTAAPPAPSSPPPPTTTPVVAEPAAAAAPVPAAAPGGPPPAGTPIESPSVGLFWRAPSPGAPPFVEVGARVAAGDTVAIVEVMKLMNHVVASVDGLVTAILVENGAAVEYGEALIVVDPEG
jgi:acetyl-CoA carboxylase biotin carboxyl carrier protein